MNNKQRFQLFRSALPLIAFFLFLATPARAADITTGLVGWWKLDGNGKDSSGRGNDGTVTGATATADRFGRASTAMNFDLSSYVTINATLGNFGTSDFSVTGWYNTTTLTRGYMFSKREICGIGSFWNIKFDPPNLGAEVYDYSSGAHWIALWDTQPSSDGIWHLFVLTRSGSNIVLYRDNNAVDSTSTAYLFDLANTADLYVGKNPCDMYNGLVDDVRIYNRALTAADVTQLYNNGGPTVVRNGHVGSGVIK